MTAPYFSSRYTTNATMALMLAMMLLSSVCAIEQQQHDNRMLPMWAAPWEQNAPKGLKRRNRDLQDEVIGANLPMGKRVRLPSEMEPVASVLLSYQYFKAETVDLINHLITSTSVDVFVVGGPDNLIDSDRYYPLPFLSESVWTRDYGPVGVLLSNDDDEDEVETLALVSPRYRHWQVRVGDDDMPCNLASVFEDWDCIEMTLILDGGNVMSDGEGNLFTTTRVYDWNPDYTQAEVDEYLKMYFGAETIHALEYAKDSEGGPMDGTGHIDMIAKIVEPCVVIVAETDAEVYADITQAAADYFAALECGPQNGTFYQVLRVPAYTRPFALPWGESVDAWVTYTNSLIVNDVVIIPSYSDGQNDLAESIYRAASNRTVLLSNTDGPIQYGGAVHCLTRQLPAAVNSPSQFALTIPNVTCTGVSRETCDLSAADPFCEDVYWTLQYAVTESECAWNELFFGVICCSEADERIFIAPTYEEDEETQTVVISLTFDEAPWETAWVIVDDATGSSVASSPYYDASMANARAKVELNLIPGVYTFVMLDSNGDGTACCQNVDLSNGEYLTETFGFDVYEATNFVVPEIEPETPPSPPPSSNNNENSISDLNTTDDEVTAIRSSPAPMSTNTDSETDTSEAVMSTSVAELPTPSSNAMASLHLGCGAAFTAFALFG